MTICIAVVVLCLLLMVVVVVIMGDCVTGFVAAVVLFFRFQTTKVKCGMSQRKRCIRPRGRHQGHP